MDEGHASVTFTLYYLSQISFLYLISPSVSDCSEAPHCIPRERKALLASYRNNKHLVIKSDKAEPSRKLVQVMTQGMCKFDSQHSR